jgi:hypothetical protein
MQKVALLTPPAPTKARVSHYVEPSLDEADAGSPNFTRSSPREKARVAAKLMSALLPNANRAARRAALQKLNRSKKAK